MIGSFRLDARMLGPDLVEWTANNEMSLKSYFGDNWTRGVGVALVDDNARPEPSGTTRQTIVWRTDLSGNMQ